jgi:ribosomal protein L11 methyltransferase
MIADFSRTLKYGKSKGQDYSRTFDFFLLPDASQQILHLTSYITHHTSPHMNHIKISISNLNREQKEVLIAVLSQTGFDGFEEGHDSLVGYVDEALFDEAGLKELASSYSFNYAKELVQAQNWNESWEKNFHPVVVDDFCAIRAEFHPPVTGTKHDIVITPKMSFGTGHHATTFMMVQWMGRDDYKGKRVLDFGTGTGVLAILAEKLGAAEIDAIDNDDWSIENAAENILFNGCSRITLAQADHLSFNKKFDIILANINRNVLLANMAQLQQHLDLSGVLIMSGLLSGDREIIEKTAKEAGLAMAAELQKDGWIALRFNHG